MPPTVDLDAPKSNIHITVVDGNVQQFAFSLADFLEIVPLAPPWSWHFLMQYLDNLEIHYREIWYKHSKVSRGHLMIFVDPNFSSSAISRLTFLLQQSVSVKWNVSTTIVWMPGTYIHVLYRIKCNHFGDLEFSSSAFFKSKLKCIQYSGLLPNTSITNAIPICFSQY